MIMDKCYEGKEEAEKCKKLKLLSRESGVQGCIKAFPGLGKASHIQKSLQPHMVSGLDKSWL